MKQVVAILNKILEIAKDVKVWFRVLIFVIALFAGAILFSRTKVKTDLSCEKQRGELIQALIDIRTELQPATSAVYYEGPVFASDTVPKVKSQQQQIQKVLSKLDSLILKYRIPQQKQKS